MADSNAFQVPEGAVPGSRTRDNIQAAIQEAADIIRELKRRVEDREGQTEKERSEKDRQDLHQLSSRWEQEDPRWKEGGTAHDAQIEDYERRMKEQDARIKENLRDIERRLDALESDRGEAGDVEEGASEG